MLQKVWALGTVPRKLHGSNSLVYEGLVHGGLDKPIFTCQKLVLKEGHILLWFQGSVMPPPQFKASLRRGDEFFSQLFC